MYPSSATTAAPAGGGGEAAAAAQCRGCSAPLPRAALGCAGILMFETAETRDLCARCTLAYYYRTGGLGAGRSSSAGHAHATCPFAFAAAATPPPPAENQSAVPRPKSNRCAACRCGGTFCSMHRHADSHGCSFDCRGFAREAGANR